MSHRTRHALQSRASSLMGLSVAFIFVACALAALPAKAQDDGQFKSLSAPVQRVARQLSALSNLPSRDWRFHAGDIAHGEAVNLDDSGWPAVKKGDRGPREAVWYRQWVEVPKSLNGYDLTGTRIRFQLHVWGNGPMPEIVFFNGRRVAMGDDLEPIVLFDQAKPGDKVLLAVKIQYTEDEKYFGGTDF